jgi:acetoin utilization deacetylase AcuC-like enzyme
VTTLAAFVPSPDHVFPGHPEEPGRLSQVKTDRDGVEWIAAKPALPEEISRVHTKELVQSIQLVCEREPGIIDFAPTYVTSTSFEDSLLAAGATLDVTRKVMAGEASNGFAIVRPPGHHAEPQRSMGFCIFNNIAIAAQDALERGAQRALIVDYDAHHGNGSQAYTWGNERVAYLSTHQEHIYPGSGTIEDAPHARKRIVNVPLPERSGDIAFSHITSQLIAPFIQNFQPSLILVSAGFDSHWSDPLTSLGLTNAGFHSISKALVELAGEWCKGRIVFVLEGGYNPVNVAQGVEAVFAALTGTAAGADSDGPSPYREPQIETRVESIRKLHGFQL